MLLTCSKLRDWAETSESTCRNTVEAIRILIQALGGLVGTLDVVTLYSWTLPDDLAPLKSAIAAMIAGTARLACFTSGVQVDNIFEMATRMSLAEPLRRSMLERMVIASIGPLTSERLEHFGIQVDVEPEHPKLGHLILAAAERAHDALAAKRAAAHSASPGAVT